MTLSTSLQPVVGFTTSLAVASGAGLTPVGSLNTVVQTPGITQVALVNTGLQGPPGPPGPGATTYDHVQSSPATEWVINHNLGRLVSTTLLNAGGFEVDAEVVQTSENQARAYFNLPQTGKVLVR